MSYFCYCLDMCIFRFLNLLLLYSLFHQCVRHTFRIQILVNTEMYYFLLHKTNLSLYLYLHYAALYALGWCVHKRTPPRSLGDKSLSPDKSIFCSPWRYIFFFSFCSCLAIQIFFFLYIFFFCSLNCFFPFVLLGSDQFWPCST